MMRAPTQEEIRRSPSRKVMGLPARVDMDDGSWACLNVAAVVKGDPDPWRVHTEHLDGSVLDIHTATSRAVYVSDRKVSAEDLGKVERAIAIRQNGARGDSITHLEAGRVAMRIRDSMVRARLLDAVEGFEAIADSGKVLDEDEKNGTLVRPSEELELDCNVLIMTCPSTGRKYAECVPTSCATALAARLWQMNLDELPDAET